MKLWRRKTARAYIFDPEKRLFLLAKSSLPPFHTHLPGGGINRGESPEEAVRRELREELHIQTENIISISYIESRKSTTMYIPHLDYIFLVIVKNVQVKLSWEIKEACWTQPEALRDSENNSIINKAQSWK
jgi:8-oxo-dGTP pyrophosphatase MutT (NUDIX family)